jgi:hypothetical protein
VAGGWRRLHDEKLHNLYTSPNIIRVIKSRRMRWVHTWERREMGTKFWSENLKGGDHSVHLGVDVNTVSEWTFEKLSGKVWIVCIWLRTGTSDGLLFTQ